MEVIERLTAVQARVREANALEQDLAAQVKKLHNETYAPLCERKKLATREAEAARKELKALLDENQELVEAVKGLKRSK